MHAELSESPLDIAERPIGVSCCSCRIGGGQCCTSNLDASMHNSPVGPLCGSCSRAGSFLGQVCIWRCAACSSMKVDGVPYIWAPCSVVTPAVDPQPRAAVCRRPRQPAAAAVAAVAAAAAAIAGAFEG